MGFEPATGLEGSSAERLYSPSSDLKAMAALPARKGAARADGVYEGHKSAARGWAGAHLFASHV